MAFSAEDRSARVTNPKPRGRDVPRSMGRKTSVTVPNSPKAWRRRGSSVAVVIDCDDDDDDVFLV
eukprot:scaffold2243_cov73-Cyclotella_meneghiniana.AAC.10